VSVFIAKLACHWVLLSLRSGLHFHGRKHLYGSGMIADQIEILRVFPLSFGQLTNCLKGSAYFVSFREAIIYCLCQVFCVIFPQHQMVRLIGYLISSSGILNIFCDVGVFSPTERRGSQPPEIVGEVGNPLLETLRRLWWRAFDRCVVAFCPYDCRSSTAYTDQNHRPHPPT
jgi:hypothetical protein